LLQRFAEEVSEFGSVEHTPLIDGRNMVMVIGPLKSKTDAKAEQNAKRNAAKEAARGARVGEPATSRVDASTSSAQRPVETAPAASPVELVETKPAAKAPVAKAAPAKAPAAKSAPAKAPATRAAAAKAPAAKPAAAKAPAAAAKPAAAKAPAKPKTEKPAE
jgi:translation initiation factor IF-3